MWEWLSKPENQSTLAFLGGGAVVVATGIWAVIQFFYKNKPKPAEDDIRAAQMIVGDGIIANGKNRFKGVNIGQGKDR